MMKRFGKTVAIVLIAICLATAIVCLSTQIDKTSPQAAEPSAPPLVFNESGEFTILHLSDFHEWMGIEKVVGVDVQDTLKPLLETFVRKSVEIYSPDLIVLGGDNIFSLSALYDAIGEVSLNTYRHIAMLMEELDVYWTMTFGNHDAESAKNKYDFMEVVESYPHFIGGIESGKYYESFVLKAKDGESDYVSNFMLPIYKYDTASQNGSYQVAYNIFILDSGSFDYVNHKDGYRSIRPEQTAWYADMVAQNPEVPSLMFTHIPFPECTQAYLTNGGTGIWEPISPSYVQTDILSTIMELKNTRAVFFGHNHLNGWTGCYDDGSYSLTLGVTPMAQAQSYSDQSSKMSGRVITLNENGTFETEVFNNRGF